MGTTVHYFMPVYKSITPLFLTLNVNLSEFTKLWVMEVETLLLKKKSLLLFSITDSFFYKIVTSHEVLKIKSNKYW